MSNIPNYLKDYSDAYASNPHTAAMEWFRSAKYGLFLHYGLYSILGRHEWVQFNEKIPVAEYSKLRDQFTADNFDARRIVDFAVRAGMKYINLTTRHHECFCLWDTEETDFNSVNSPAKRDLVGELAGACDEAGIGFFCYYSHGRDWKHPHAPNNDQWGGSARPEYDPPEPSYAYGEDHDLQKYLDFMTDQITELLSNYGPIAGIWLDGIAVPKSGDKAAFRCQELYDHIHSLQPQCLVSYKQGLLGTEDFYAPERQSVTSENRLVEICDTMNPHSWGYTIRDEGAHKTADEVWEVIRNARSQKCNLLLNTGPLPDGSLHEQDAAELLEVGERLRKEGFPEGQL